jgi:hypothetical protein
MFAAVLPLWEAVYVEFKRLQINRPRKSFGDLRRNSPYRNSVCTEFLAEQILMELH